MPTLSPEAWAKIRYAYEHTDRTLGDIAAEFGIAKDTITRRRQLWGWRLRRPAVPRQGPVALGPLALGPLPRVSVFDEAKRPLPNPPPHVLEDGRERPFAGEGKESVAGEGEDCSPQRLVTSCPVEEEERAAADDPFPSPHLTHAARPEREAISIGDSVSAAIARVMPALEATLARLAGPMEPRHMSEANRALALLTRTLRELNTLVAQHPPAAQTHEDVAALRESVARKLDAIVAEGEAGRAAERETERARRAQLYEAAWLERAESCAEEFADQTALHETANDGATAEGRGEEDNEGVDERPPARDRALRRGPSIRSFD